MDVESLFPAITALLGTVVGALASAGGGYLLERRRERSEAEAVTGAIVTEIRATLAVVRERKYLEDIEATLAKLERGELSTATFQAQLPETPYPVFKSQLGKIGVIPPSLRNDIVMFYQLLEAVICDIRPGGNIAEGAPLESWLQLRNLAKQAYALGTRIVERYDSGLPVRR